MTTIAYRDGIIAYDSYCIQGSTIVDDNYNKHHVFGDLHVFAAGGCGDEIPLIAWFLDNSKEVSGISVDVLIWDGNILHMASMDKDGPWSTEERTDNVIAIGSGMPYALTAMDMGATAKEAVKMAAKRDVGTGGRIRTFKL